jgi:hypothetical protein
MTRTLLVLTLLAACGEGAGEDGDAGPVVRDQARVFCEARITLGCYGPAAVGAEDPLLYCLNAVCERSTLGGLGCNAPAAPGAEDACLADLAADGFCRYVPTSCGDLLGFP